MLPGAGWMTGRPGRVKEIFFTPPDTVVMTRFFTKILRGIDAAG
jgi:hypothetical protein